VRDVWLAEDEGIVVRRQQIRSKIANGNAQVHDSVHIENRSAKEQKLSVVAPSLHQMLRLSELRLRLS